MRRTLSEPSLSVVVICHEEYLHFLPEAMDGFKDVEAKKILVLDGVTDIPVSTNGWHVIRKFFGNPGAARNAALPSLRDQDWVYFWDADNVSCRAYYDSALQQVKAASETTAVLSHGSTNPRHMHGVDSNAPWRVRALNHIGGFPEGRLEDWCAARNLQEAGWDIGTLYMAPELRGHPLQRSQDSSIDVRKWNSMTYGIITLQTNVKRFHTWLDSLRRLHVPVQGVGLTVVMDTHDKSEAKQARSMVADLDVTRSCVIHAPRKSEKLPDSFFGVHNRVGYLYAKAFRVTPEQRVLTWEHDVIPPEDGLVLLSQDIGGAAAIAGLYQGRVNGRPGAPYSISMSTEAWQPPKELPDRPFRAGMVPGGFTLWNGGCLERCPFLGPLIEDRGKLQLGWDGYMSWRLSRMGMTVKGHPGVICQHNL